jgi:hypothetical protein
MFEKIKDLILLNIAVTFSSELYGFKISLTYNEKEEMVVLPHCHLTDNKIIKYIDFMVEKILGKSQHLIKVGDIVEYTYTGNNKINVEVLKVKANGKLILNTRKTTGLIKNVCVLPHRVKLIKTIKS